LAALGERFGSFDAPPMRLAGAPTFWRQLLLELGVHRGAPAGSSGISAKLTQIWSRFWILPLALNFLAEVDAWHWRHWHRLGCGVPADHQACFEAL
jgi:hypothetical protein